MAAGDPRMLMRVFDDAVEESDLDDFIDTLRDCDSMFPDEATARSAMDTVGKHMAASPDALDDLDALPQLAELLMATPTPPPLLMLCVSTLLFPLMDTSAPPPDAVAAAYCAGRLRGQAWTDHTQPDNAAAQHLHAVFFPKGGHPLHAPGAPLSPLAETLSSAVLAQAGAALTDMQRSMLPPAELPGAITRLLDFAQPLLPLPGVAAMLALAFPALSRLAGPMGGGRRDVDVHTRLFSFLHAIPQHLHMNHVGIQAAHVLLHTRVPMSQRRQLQQALASLAQQGEQLSCAALAHVLIKTPMDTELANAALQGLAASAPAAGLDAAQDGLGALSHAADVDERHPEHGTLSAVAAWCAHHHDSLVDPPPPPAVAAAAGASLLLGKTLRQAVLLLAVRHAVALPPPNEDAPPTFSDVWRSAAWGLLLRDVEALLRAAFQTVLTLGGQGGGVPDAPLAGHGLHTPSLLAGLAVPLLPTESHQHLPRALLNDVAHALSWGGVKQEVQPPSSAATEGFMDCPWAVFKRGSAAAEHTGNMNAVANQHAMAKAQSAAAAAAMLAARALGAVAFTLGAAASTHAPDGSFLLRKLALSAPSTPGTPLAAGAAAATGAGGTPATAAAAPGNAPHSGTKRPRSASNSAAASHAAAAAPKRARPAGGGRGGLAAMSLSKKRRRPAPSMAAGRQPPSTPSTAAIRPGPPVRQQSAPPAEATGGGAPRDDRLFAAGAAWVGLFPGAQTASTAAHDAASDSSAPPLPPLAAAVCLLLPQCLAVASAVESMPAGLMHKSAAALHMALCSASMFPLSCDTLALLPGDGVWGAPCLASAYTRLGMTDAAPQPSSSGAPLDAMLLHRHIPDMRLLLLYLVLPQGDAPSATDAQLGALRRCGNIMLTAAALHEAPPPPPAAEGAHTPPPPLASWTIPARLKPRWHTTDAHPPPASAAAPPPRLEAAELSFALHLHPAALPHALHTESPSAQQLALVAAAAAAQLAVSPPRPSAHRHAAAWVSRAAAACPRVTTSVETAAATILGAAWAGGYAPLLALQLHRAARRHGEWALDRLLARRQQSPAAASAAAAARDVPACPQWLLSAAGDMPAPALDALLGHITPPACAAWLLTAFDGGGATPPAQAMVASVARTAGVDRVATALGAALESLRHKASAAADSGQALPLQAVTDARNAYAAVLAGTTPPLDFKRGGVVHALLGHAADGHVDALPVLDAVLQTAAAALSAMDGLYTQLPPVAAPPAADTAPPCAPCSTALLAAVMHPGAILAHTAPHAVAPWLPVLLRLMHSQQLPGLAQQGAAVIALLSAAQQDGNGRLVDALAEASVQDTPASTAHPPPLRPAAPPAQGGPRASSRCRSGAHRSQSRPAANGKPA